VLPHIISPPTLILANSLIEAIVSDITTAIQVVLFILTLLWIFAYVFQSERCQTRNVLVTAHHCWLHKASKGTDHWTGTLYILGFLLKSRVRSVEFSKRVGNLGSFPMYEGSFGPKTLQRSGDCLPDMLDYDTQTALTALVSTISNSRSPFINGRGLDFCVFLLTATFTLCAPAS
jgi:hypothetical protein